MQSTENAKEEEGKNKKQSAADLTMKVLLAIATLLRTSNNNQSR